MKKKETANLAVENLGKQKRNQKSIEEVIRPDFAYK